MRTPVPARAKLLASAARLFYDRGVTATGIDAITAHAGVAKKSLYNNFSSKEDLLQAYLHERDREWVSLYRARVRGASTSAERVLAVFDAYIDHAQTAYEHGFRGCGLLNAAAELPASSAGRDIVRRHKAMVEELLAEDLRAMTQPENAETMAEHLAFLLEGAMSRAGLEGEPDRLYRARQLGQQLLDRL